MDGTIVVLIILACCVISCVIALVVWSMGGPAGLNIGKDKLLGALSGFEFTKAILPNIASRAKPELKPYGFRKYIDYATDDSVNIGAPVPDKTIDKCNELCAANSQCRGFSIEGNVCQLKNNVTILNRVKGREVYASTDVGEPKFLKVPFARFEDGVVPPMYTFTGSYIDAAANCISNTSCQGMTYSGTTATMYNAVIGVDINTPGLTYTSPNSQLKFFIENSTTYTDPPTKTTTSDTQFMKPASFNPVNPIDNFAMWRSGWDAGLSKASAIEANTKEECSNACMSNAHCEAFVLGTNGDKGCWLKGDLQAQAREVCRSQADAAFGCLTAGTKTIYGEDNSKRDTYFKYQETVDRTCPASCANDPDCTAVSFNTSTCKRWDTEPKTKKTDPAWKTVWNYKKYPR